MPAASSSLINAASVYVPAVPSRASSARCRGTRALRAGGHHALRVHLIADAACRKDRLLILELRLRIVATLDVGAAEAGELDRLPRGGENHPFALAGGRGDLDARLFHTRVHHLRRHRALPDQLVQAQVVAVEHRRQPRRRHAEIGRPDRLVRFLRVLHLRLIAARAVVVLGTKHVANHARRLVQRLFAQGRAVGAVVGDETFHLPVAHLDPLKQALRDLHRSRGREAKLAAGLLRERRRRERRRRTLDARLLVDRGDLPWQLALEDLPVGARASSSRWRTPRVFQRARRGIEVLARGDAGLTNAARAWPGIRALHR